MILTACIAGSPRNRPLFEEKAIFLSTSSAVATNSTSKLLMARSENVFKARRNVTGAYHLCQLCAKATRKMLPGAGSIGDTINLALIIIGNGKCNKQALISMSRQVAMHRIADDDDEHQTGQIARFGAN